MSNIRVGDRVTIKDELLRPDTWITGVWLVTEVEWFGGEWVAWIDQPGTPMAAEIGYMRGLGFMASIHLLKLVHRPKRWM